MTRLSKTAQRIADERAAEGLLCHCRGDGAGHTAAPDCDTPLSAQRVPVGWPRIKATVRHGRYIAQRAHGTCRKCGQRVTLRAVAVFAAEGVPGFRLGAVLGRTVESVAHRDGGRSCTERAIVETTYRLPRKAEALVAAYGPDAIETHPVRR